MDSKNKKDGISEWNILGSGDFPNVESIVAIGSTILIINVIEWLINLFMPENELKLLKPNGTHFHVVSKKKIIAILCISISLILALFSTYQSGLFPSMTLQIFYVLAVLIIVVSLFMTITLSTQVIICADDEKFYIKYNWCEKEKVEPIAIKQIRKITIKDDKIKIMTKFGLTTKFKRYLLTVEPDSDAYAYFLRLKQELDV